MAESTADVRRDIELTRERMSDTIAQLERKFDVVQVVRDNPLPALAIAAGAGFLFARSSRHTRRMARTAIATTAVRGRVGGVLDDVTSRFLSGVSDVLGQRVDGWVDNLRDAIVPQSHDGRANGRAD
jgi:hypothetical protein